MSLTINWTPLHPTCSTGPGCGCSEETQTVADWSTAKGLVLFNNTKKKEKKNLWQKTRPLTIYGG